jgi:hypothetical protein
METTFDLILDSQIDIAWGNANFGDIHKRVVIGNALLKYASGYRTGHTIECICYELKLVTKNNNLTTLGKRYLFAHFSNNLSV